MDQALSEAVGVVSKIDPITSLTLVLAALSALLTVLAIMIGVAAVWGYFGIRDSVKEMATKRVDDAIKDVLTKYPNAADILKALKRLEANADFMDEMRNQAVTATGPKSVARASNDDVQQEVTEVTITPDTPLESTAQQVTPIEQYPGEEESDAADAGKTPPK